MEKTEINPYEAEAQRLIQKLEVSKFVVSLESSKMFRRHSKRRWFSSQASPDAELDIVSYCKNITADELQDPQNAWLARICSNCSKTEDQVELIWHAIKLQPHHFKIFRDICVVVESAVKQSSIAKNLNVHIFGSIFTELALKGSDVDICLDFTEELNIPPEKLTKMLAKIIYRTKCFVRAIPILARVPVVKCIHKSRISCDISFSNKFGILNSLLVKFLLTLDPRISKIIMILKFLLGKQDLVGPQGIPSYGIIMLVIFFMQQLDISILPPISNLQFPALQKEFLEGWDVSFIKDKKQIPKTVNSMTIVQLLHEFFKFYAQFDFGIYVISIYAGKCFLKPIFEKPELLPPIFEIYKEKVKQSPREKFELEKYICVQDVFKHSVNVTRNVMKKTLTGFRELCFKCANLCEKENESSVKKDSSDLLKALFGCEVKTGVKKKKMDMREMVIYMDKFMFFEDSTEMNEKSLRKCWIQKMLSVITDIMHKIIKCDVRLCNQEELVANCESCPDTYIMECEMKHFVLSQKKRNLAKQNCYFSRDLSLIEREALISSYLCQRSDTCEDFHVTFKIKITAVVKPTRVLIRLENNKIDEKSKPKTTQVFAFIHSFFPKWVEMALDDLSVKTKKNKDINI